MKSSFSWIKEYLNIALSPEEVCEALTLAGLEAEGIEEIDGDVVLDIDLTPNLGHCMSIIGIVRELSAILNLPIHRKKIELQETSEKTADHLKISIEDPTQCHRYSSRLIKNLTVGPSPDWLKKALELSGVRSVNNVVDVGNYVMLACGQPLHLFDANQITGKHLIVRAAVNEGTMITLDDQERAIQDGVLLICDESRPIAFAGVMGEKKTAVSDKTTNVIIEAAHFTPEAVRKTSKVLNLRTDSSSRFERGIDPLGVTTALDWAAYLLTQIANGAVCKGIVEAVAQEYTPHLLEMNPERANRLLGTHLSIREMSTLLGRLEFEILSELEDIIRVQVPSYRNDVRAEIDLIEEIGRLYGLNHIPRKKPRHTSSTMSHAPLFLFEEQIRSALIAQGLQECLTCDLISPKLAELSSENALDNTAHVHVLHPASIDQSVLRPSLLPGLLEVIKFNLDRQTTTIAAFEVGHVHFKKDSSYFEQSEAALILTGQEFPYHHAHKPDPVDFFDIKGRVCDLLSAIGLNTLIIEPSHLHSLHPGRQARVTIDDVNVGAFGEVHPKLLRELGIGQRVYYAELNLHDLIQLKKSHIRVKALSPFPGSERDWTITVEQKTKLGPVLREIKAQDAPLLEDVFLFDLYKSEKLGKNKMNLTLRFKYRDQNKTIEFEEVEKEHKRLTQHIAEKLTDGVS